MAEYICVYGMSSTMPSLASEETILSTYDGLIFYTFPSRKGKVFWILIQKADKQYFWPDIPRFTTSDAERLCHKIGHYRVADGVRFRDIFDRRLDYKMAAAEEYILDHWYFDRIVCLGDSMHKVSPAIQPLYTTSRRHDGAKTFLLIDIPELLSRSQLRHRERRRSSEQVI